MIRDGVKDAEEQGGLPATTEPSALREPLLPCGSERLLLNNKMLGFLASGRDEFNPGPETRLGLSGLLCNKVLLKYKGDRESF